MRCAQARLDSAHAETARRTGGTGRCDILDIFCFCNAIWSCRPLVAWVLEASAGLAPVNCTRPFASACPGTQSSTALPATWDGAD